MRKHNFLKAVATVLCMALLISGTAFAATPGQALDAKEVKYGTLSRADQNILKGMFNAEEYAAMNEDVVKAVGKDANKLFAHFIKYGVFEGRGPSKSFNVSAYMSSYGDLQKAFGKDIMAYYRHYNNYGKKEKRELVTVEKAEAAGVVIKSVTGATKTVLPPSVQNPSSGSSGSVQTPVVTRINYFDGSAITALTQAEFAELTESAAAEEPSVAMLHDTLSGMTVYYREDAESTWTSYKAAQEAIIANINADIRLLDDISVNAPNGSSASEVLGLINTEIAGLALNLSGWSAAEIVSGYTATTEGSQTVSVRFSNSAESISLPIDITVVVAAASGGGGGATAVEESDISTTNKTLTLTAGYATGNTVSLAATAVEDVAFTYAETTDAGDCFTIDASSGLVTFATGKDESASPYTATFTITATGSDTREGTATKEVTVSVTVNAAATAVEESDISTTDETLTLIAGYATGNTVSLAATAVEDVEFTYAETTDTGDCFTIDASSGLVTFATGKDESASPYTATFTITATGSGTRTGTATKTVTVTVTVSDS
ncbi:MAG: hypothetical protein IK018_13320 [Lachnospiraceae bacterium]|nr:hypothetical protein [Lachnospiraceae bacterium]